MLLVIKNRALWGKKRNTRINPQDFTVAYCSTVVNQPLAQHTIMMTVYFYTTSAVKVLFRIVHMGSKNEINIKQVYNISSSYI